ncbi:group XIIA secretory phospholipase A2 [Motacilla alba alba]|nr:group XIIA secretory phospholipase A2 [Motacilla alba alba]
MRTTHVQTQPGQLPSPPTSPQNSAPPGALLSRRRAASHQGRPRLSLPRCGRPRTAEGTGHRGHGTRDRAQGARQRGHSAGDKAQRTRSAPRRCPGAAGGRGPSPRAGARAGPRGPWRPWRWWPWRWQRAGPGGWRRRRRRLSGLGMAPARLSLLPLLLLVVVVAACGWRPARGQEAPQTPDWRMTLKTIRNGVHKIDMYLNAALDLLGGEDGLCQYKCSDGSRPVPRYGYKPSPPNGCGSPLFGVQFDIGIPSMTRCCNHHDRCYDTCGNKKNDCDEQFQTCLSKICRDVQKTLGISESVQACESTVQLLFDAVIHLGCKPYLDSQRAACMCHSEGKTDL